MAGGGGGGGGGGGAGSDSGIKPDSGYDEIKRGSSIYTPEDIKAGFEGGDTNGDGFLDFEELRALLVRGRSDITEKQLRMLWRGVDIDRDGRVEFDEFVDFIHGKKSKSHKEKWEDTFLAFSGKDECLNKDEFMTLCTASGLLSKSMSEKDAEAIFQKTCKPTGVVGAKGFSKTMARIAKQKKVKKKEVIKAVTECSGPHRHLDWSPMAETE